MGKSRKTNQQVEKPKPSIPQSIMIYGGFIYRTLEYFGVSGSDILQWLETLPPKLPEIWNWLQHCI